MPPGPRGLISIDHLIPTLRKRALVISCGRAAMARNLKKASREAIQVANF